VSLILSTLGEEDLRVFEVSLANPKDGVSLEEHRTLFKDMSLIAIEEDGVLVY